METDFSVVNSCPLVKMCEAIIARCVVQMKIRY